MCHRTKTIVKMKNLLSIIVLLFGVVAINAQVRKATFRNVYVTNAGMAGISGDEALKQIQLVTSGGASVLFDLEHSRITLNVHLPEKTDVFIINETNKEEGGNIMYSCTGTKDQGEVAVLEYRDEDCIILGFKEYGVIFLLTDKSKNEILGLY